MHSDLVLELVLGEEGGVEECALDGLVDENAEAEADAGWVGLTKKTERRLGFLLELLPAEDPLSLSAGVSL